MSICKDRVRETGDTTTTQHTCILAHHTFLFNSQCPHSPASPLPPPNTTNTTTSCKAFVWPNIPPSPPLVQCSYPLNHPFSVENGGNGNGCGVESVSVAKRGTSARAITTRHTVHRRVTVYPVWPRCHRPRCWRLQRLDTSRAVTTRLQGL